jgi:hypothetical protein
MSRREIAVSAAAEQRRPSTVAEDLRTPDARDAGLVAQGLIERPGAVSTTPAPAAPQDGFDWGDAAIGAAGALALGLLATGAIVAVRRRSHRSQPATA